MRTSTPTPNPGPNKAGFVFGESGETGPNKILGLLPVDTYLVQYTDGAGKKEVRLVFKAEGSNSSFMLNEKIQGAFTATASTAWFNQALSKKLAETSPEENSEDGAESL